MKIMMTDVFNAEMTADDINVYMGPKLIKQGDGEDKFDCADRYAAHAINCHDDLVRALGDILSSSRGTSGRIIIEKEQELEFYEILAKARGE